MRFIEIAIFVLATAAFKVQGSYTPEDVTKCQSIAMEIPPNYQPSGVSIAVLLVLVAGIPILQCRAFTIY